MSTFLKEISEEENKVINQMRKIILEFDSNVNESTGEIMSSKNCFIYKEQGVFKYGIAKTKNHFSFHSMVMYANKELIDWITDNSKSLKIQKGCLNFKNANDFPLPLFKEFLIISSKSDFSKVIDRYKNKK